MTLIHQAFLDSNAARLCLGPIVSSARVLPHLRVLPGPAPQRDQHLLVPTAIGNRYTRLRGRQCPPNENQRAKRALHYKNPYFRTNWW